MSFKSLIAKGLHRVGSATGLSLSRAKKIQAGRIIMFHGVGDDEYTQAEFADHLQFLARHFNILSMDDFVSRLQKGKKLSNEVVLTFDDGLRNNLTSAYPVLKKLDLPAVFFVCPGLVERQGWLWNHDIRARLRAASADQRAGYVAELKARCGSGVEQIVDWMKSLPMSDRRVAEEFIRSKSKSFVPSSAQKAKYDIMNWDELLALDPDLITIGSHTVNHPILSTLAPEELACEIAESRRLLEHKLDRIVEQFCYPNGALNPVVVAEVRKHYRIAVTTEAGFVHAGRDLIQLPRIGIAPEPLFSWRLHRPTA